MYFQTTEQWQQYYNDFTKQNLTTEDDPNAEFFAGHWLNLSETKPLSLEIFLSAINRLPKLGGEIHSRTSVDYEDVVTSNSSRPWFRRGEDNDSINGTQGNDRILSREGHDKISLGKGDDIVWTYTGNDVVFGGEGNDKIYMHEGNDFANGGAGNDLMHGGGGSDRIRGGDGDDTIFGGKGFYDKIYGNNGDDTLFGDGGQDWLWGSNDDDTLYGGVENDSLWGGNDQDILFGGDGDDWESGGAGDDTIFGGAGDDEMHGDRGNDFLACRDGEDWMIGGSGDDTLLTISDAGSPLYSINDADSVASSADSDDRLTGGSGADDFVISYQVSTNEELASNHLDEDGKIDWNSLVEDPTADVWLNWGGVETIDDFNRSEGDQIFIKGHSIALNKLTHIDTNDDGVLDSTQVVLQSDFNTVDPNALDLVGLLHFSDVLLTEEDLQIDDQFVDGEFLTL